MSGKMAADRIHIVSKIGYTTLQNSMIVDKRLSLKTKGLMAVMLSRPEGWDFSVSGLAAFCGCGKDTIRSALKELETAGYLTRQQLHSESGAFAGNFYELSPYSELTDESATPLSENPTTVDAPLSDFPSSGKPSSGNPTQRNKDLKKERLKEPPIAPQGGRREKSVPRWKPERFSAFWDFYSHNVRGESRQTAVKAWDKLRPDDALISVMGQALLRQLATDEWKRGVGLPYASTWLNNRRWEDVPSRRVDGGRSDEGEDDGIVRESGYLSVW